MGWQAIMGPVYMIIPSPYQQTNMHMWGSTLHQRNSNILVNRNRSCTGTWLCMIELLVYNILQPNWDALEMYCTVENRVYASITHYSNTWGFYYMHTCGVAQWYKHEVNYIVTIEFERAGFEFHSWISNTLFPLHVAYTIHTWPVRLVQSKQLDVWTSACTQKCNLVKQV